MSITFPTTLDNFSNPTGTDLLENSNAALDHDVQHSNANDAIEALQAKVGVDGSAVTTSFDYKLSEVTSTDKAVGKTATQTLTNKTLTSPKVNVGSDATADMYYRGADGTLTRIPIGASTQILTSDGSVPSWQNNAAGSDASTTVKGVVEEATAAELAAGTAAGGTGARLFANPSTLMPGGKIDRNYISASFGGTGADGALTITSGTTTIDLGGAAIVTKNYTSISITGTGALAFSNPNSAGTIVVLKSQGGVTITSSANPVIDMRNLGATGGAAGSAGSTGIGSGGAGGGNLQNSGSNSGAASSSDGTVGTSGANGTCVFGTITGGQGGRITSTNTATGGTGTVTGVLPSTIIVKGIPFGVGAGGGGAAGSNPSGSSVSGAGGRGAGSLYIECAGAFNFTTGTINLAGTAGTNGSGTFGSGGGGGAGGTLLALCGSITANSGTITTTGGSGGSTTAGSVGGAGANGASLVALNTEFV